MTERACHIEIESEALNPSTTRLLKLEGHEGISRFFEFELSVVCTGTDTLDEDAVLSKPAAIVFTRDGSPERRIFGAISKVRDALLTEADHLVYTLTFVPRLWPMMHGKRSEIFLDLAVPDIIKQKLASAGAQAGDDFELRLNASYAPREFVMQYEETDLQFCTRLSEHLGISFFFEHQSGKDVLVFSDDNSGFKPIEGDATLTFYRRGERLGVFDFRGETKTLPARYVLKDYNYRTPSVALVATASVDGAGKGDVVEYGAHFKTQDEGNAVAKVRAEELLATKRVYTARSEIPRIACGARFTLDGHPKVEGELLVTEVKHEATQPVLGAATGDERTYVNEFHAILATVQYRPLRVTPKPRVHGAISGVVETAPGGQYSELDDQGRYHVRFMLDQGDAAKGAASSLLRMAQPHAGPGYGHHFPLRDGVEVLLACIDGDPDRPIITAAVPNPQTPSTVSGKNGVHNVTRTGGGTVLDIDDTEGATGVTLATPFASSSLTMGASAAGIFLSTGQKALVETGDSITLLGGTCVEVVAKSTTVDVNAAIAINETAPKITEIASGSINEQAPTINVVALGNLNESAPWIDVKGGAKIRQGAPFVEINTGDTFLVQSGGEAKISASATLQLLSDGLLVISAPNIAVAGTSVSVNGSTVEVTGDGTVTIKGGTINITGGTVNVKGGPINLNC